MSRKAQLNEEQVRELGKEMTDTNVTYATLAKAKGLKAAMLYQQFKKYGITVLAGKRGRPSKKVEATVV